MDRQNQILFAVRAGCSGCFLFCVCASCRGDVPSKQCLLAMKDDGNRQNCTDVIRHSQIVDDKMKGQVTLPGQVKYFTGLFEIPGYFPHGAALRIKHPRQELPSQCCRGGAIVSPTPLWGFMKIQQHEQQSGSCHWLGTPLQQPSSARALGSQIICLPAEAEQVAWWYQGCSCLQQMHSNRECLPVPREKAVPGGLVPRAAWVPTHSRACTWH